MNYLFLIIVIAAVAGILGIAAFTNFEIDNWHYDRIKYIVIHWSFIVVFIGVIVKTFKTPYGVETVTVVGALGALLSGLLGISSTNFYANSLQSHFNDESLHEMMTEPEVYEEYEMEAEDETEDNDSEE